MPATNVPFEVAVSHSALADKVNIYMTGGGLLATMLVKTPGVAGEVVLRYPQGVTDDAVYLWEAEEENALGKGPRGLAGGFATRPPFAQPTLTIRNLSAL